jgi:hypothetical protein
LSTFRVVTEGATVFFFPLVAFEPPAEGGLSTYCWHAEQLPAPAAIAAAGTISAATKIQLAMNLREITVGTSLSRSRRDTTRTFSLPILCRC